MPLLLKLNGNLEAPMLTLTSTISYDNPRASISGLITPNTPINAWKVASELHNPKNMTVWFVRSTQVIILVPETHKDELQL
jgi:hypothetical protein